ncbi:hypothetical protein C2S52_006882, partial [Perilla frutescens var. hirtella]
MADHRQSALYIAMAAEVLKRYDEMVEAMKIVASMDSELTAQERMLLSVAYTNMFYARRTGMRILASIKSRELTDGNYPNVDHTEEYAEKLDAELTRIREDLVSILNDHVIPSSTSSLVDHVFYYKMLGDAYRHCAEFKTGDDRKNLADRALDAYMIAITRVKELPPTNHIRLALGYSVSVLHYKILGEHEIGRLIAQEYLDAASTEMEAAFYIVQPKETLDILGILGQLLTEWKK